jgi:hypothetical protein
MSQRWAPWWLWLWGLVALSLIALMFFLPFKWWALAGLIGMGGMEGLGLAHPNDAYPPLTQVVREYVPRWIAFTAIYGLVGAGGSVWLRLSHPEKLGLLFALLGWFTTHFDVTFDHAKTNQERAKYQRLMGGAKKVLSRDRQP